MSTALLAVAAALLYLAAAGIGELVVSDFDTVDVTNRSIEETSDWITHNVL